MVEGPTLHVTNFAWCGIRVWCWCKEDGGSSEWRGVKVLRPWLPINLQLRFWEVGYWYPSTTQPPFSYQKFMLFNGLINCGSGSVTPTA